MLPDQWFFNFWGDKGPFETLMKVMPPLPGEGLQGPPPHTHTHLDSASKVRVVHEILDVPRPQVKSFSPE